MSLKKLALTALAAFTLAACGAPSTSSTEKTESKKETVTVKIGVSGTNHPQWDYVKEQLKEKENINLEIVEFEDYVTPNTALEDGSIDLNAFQHILYLNKFNSEKGTHIKEIAYTMYSPMGAYSQKIKSLSELKEGDKISIPNDTTNGARALRLLHNAGVIKLNDVSNTLVTVSDIVENPKKIEIVELIAGQTYQSLPDVAAAVINANYAVDAGLTPKTDAIYLEEVNEASKPYYNVIAAREDRAKEEVFKTIVKYYQTKEVAEISNREFRGATIEIWDRAKIED
ncbi:MULTISPECIES: MetQ/NlpA family ABC transporter substrate-binding protein [unclassified Granulicatella]|uniref:MetQ/NlpA family ABC transporter substrate-binding protein n=1 Tax=unclassified Granulicatella TaxID=2630493 RepID=UPI001073943E|nr:MULTISPECIES: MetQ/NlpA family ABC transporter substrate-binding protein [unclassified Granulicatella]MBF0780446.1 MetQ/NlpA family ABC transporter substrate-binding protein [Granulicatella sp. 19428wC4_WM01]TFU95390.1 MetQ/NlpA family ABC transporter substrate-binding protein [Granulicatella sp. WM01]